MRRGWKISLWVLPVVAIIIALIAGRLYLPTWLAGYLNEQLANMNGYSGSVEDVDIHLYRGAYTIHKLTIKKNEGKIPVPFFDVETADISVEWKSLFHGRVVAEIEAQRPVINFATKGSVTQTGSEVDWTDKLKKLAPIDINRVAIHQGKVSYKNFSTTPNVDVFIHNMEGEVKNLRNVVDKNDALPSTITVGGSSIGGGKFHVDGRMNILKRVPDMEMKAKLEGVDLPAFNSYFRAFAAIDVEKGSFDGYTEFSVKDGRVQGYVKPIARNIELIDLSKSTNPIKLLWESIASMVIEVFTNQRKDQFATKFPIEGTIEGDVKSGVWEALGGIIRNAFFEAFQKGFDRGGVQE